MGRKKERAGVEQKSFPRLDLQRLKVADKNVSQGCIRRQQAKKKALSPHRGQARPLISGVGSTALLPLFLSRRAGKARHTGKGRLQERPAERLARCEEGAAHPSCVPRGRARRDARRGSARSAGPAAPQPAAPGGHPVLLRRNGNRRGTAWARAHRSGMTPSVFRAALALGYGDPRLYRLSPAHGCNGVRHRHHRIES